MKHKPSLLFVICSAVAVVLIVGAGVLVFLSFQKLKETDKELDGKKRELENVYRLDPFPSPANVRRELENRDALTDWRGKLVAEASAGQLELKEQSPSKFMTLLGSARRKLLEAAEERVDMPESFPFGFDRYFAEGSQLPEPAHVPRLMRQLVIISRLSTILIEEEIESLKAVNRDVFEGMTSGGGRRTTVGGVNANVGLLGKDDLHARLSFTLEFKAKERAVLAILNRLAEDELFMVPTQLVLQKTEEDVQLYELRASESGAMAEDEVPADSDAPLSMQERMVSGLQLEPSMDVTLKLDVYRFNREPRS